MIKNVEIRRDDLINNYRKITEWDQRYPKNIAGRKMLATTRQVLTEYKPKLLMSEFFLLNEQKPGGLLFYRRPDDGQVKHPYYTKGTNITNEPFSDTWIYYVEKGSLE
jgi:hypothetical protein